MFQLRRARPDEQKQIDAFVRQEGLNPFGIHWEHFWVAETPAGERIGCGQLKPHRDGTLELASLVTAPEWRGRGVARALITRLQAESPQDLYLMCRSGLGEFYARFGFTPVETAALPPYFRRIKLLVRLPEMILPGETVLIMHWARPS